MFRVHGDDSGEFCKHLTSGWTLVACVLIVTILASSARDDGFAAERCEAAIVRRGGFSFIEAMSVSGTQVWAVGDNGVMVLEDGNWRLYQQFDGLWLKQIDTQGNDGWIVGSSGVVLRLQDRRWIRIAAPLEADFTGVSIAENQDIWFTGQLSGEGPSESVVLRYKDEGWLTVAHPKGLSATAIEMQTSSRGWVAVRTASGSRIHQWNGERFAESAHPAVERDIITIHASDGDNAWAGGGLSAFEGLRTGGPESMLLHFDGEDWTKIDDELGFKVRDIHVTARDSAWAVGSEGNIAHYDGEEWSVQFGSGVSTWGFGAIGLIDEEDIWFAGASQVVHFSAGEFSSWGGGRYSSGEALTSIEGQPDGTLWACGWGGPVVRLDGLGWSNVHDIPSETSVDRVFIDLHGRAWFAYLLPEPGGFIAEPREGSWTIVRLPTEYPVVSLAFGGDGRIWALASRAREFDGVAPGSDILRFEDGAWRRVHEVRDGSVLHAMELVDSETAWFASSYIARLTADTWETFTIPGEDPPPILVDLSFESPDKGWFIGRRSLITYDAGTWTSQTIGKESDSRSLVIVESAGSGSVLAAGRLGIFLIDGTRQREYGVPDSSPASPRLADATITGRPGDRSAWVSGVYESIHKISLDCDEVEPPMREGLAHLPLVSK